MATTPGGLPYPIGTDKVVDGDDAIHNLALALDPPWTPITFAAGFANAAGSTTCQFRSVAGWCELRGISVAAAGIGGDVNFATGLPPYSTDNQGYPLFLVGIGQASTGLRQVGYLNVRTDGVMRLFPSSPAGLNSTVSLDGIRYRLASALANVADDLPRGEVQPV